MPTLIMTTREDFVISVRDEVATNTTAAAVS